MMARPSIPAGPHTGGCLCGAVRYRVTARPLAVNACHCVDCRRSSGGPAGVFLHVKRSDFLWDQGRLAAYRKIAESGREIDISRCAECGTRMWHEPLAVPDLVLVSAGTLDESGWAVPTSHIWTRGTARTDGIAGDALVFETAPPDRRALWERFAAIYGAG